MAKLSTKSEAVVEALGIMRSGSVLPIAEHVEEMKQNPHRYNQDYLEGFDKAIELLANGFDFGQAIAIVHLIPDKQVEAIRATKEMAESIRVIQKEFINELVDKRDKTLYNKIVSIINTNTKQKEGK